MKKYVGLLFGLALLVGVVYTFVNPLLGRLAEATLTVLQGGLVIVVALISLFLLLLSLSEFKG